MRIIDKSETIMWLSQRGLVNSNGELIVAEFKKPTQFKITVDSGRKTALSKTIASFFEAQDEALLWINEFGMWPSCEDRHLFDGFRKSLGENKPLHEKPGHIFSNKDLDVAGSLIAMVLYFCWGAIIVSSTKKFIFKISHDEMIDVYVKNKEDLAPIREKLDKFQ